MKKKIIDTLREGFDHIVPFELFEVFLLLAGIMIGLVASKYITSDNGNFLMNNTENYIAKMRIADAPLRSSLPAALISNCKYYILIIFFAYSALGTYFIPAIFAVKGFFLSFTICAYTRVLGTQGTILAMLGFGLQNLILIPAILYIGYESFKASASLMSTINQSSLHRNSAPSREFLIKCLVFGLFPLCASILECTVIPYIVYLYISSV